jgi:2-haloacid dehalogenase
MIDAVVFDIGKVLIEWHPERFYDNQIGAARRRAFFAEVDIFAMNERIDLGAPFRRTVYDFADVHPEWRDEIRMWHDRWIDMASPAIDGSVVLLRALRATGVRVLALTNFGNGPLEEAGRHYPFLLEFDKRYVSGELALIKPDERIYQALEEDSGIAPGGLLFADDRPENVAAARARGWNTHLFTGARGWAECLVARGILTADEARIDG